MNYQEYIEAKAKMVEGERREFEITHGNIPYSHTSTVYVTKGTKNYVKKAEEAVLKATLKALEVYKRPVTLLQISEMGGIMPDLPRTTYISSANHYSGGRSPFAFPDRVLRFLKRLEWKGKVSLEKKDRKWYADYPSKTGRVLCNLGKGN